MVRCLVPGISNNGEVPGLEKVGMVPLLREIRRSSLIRSSLFAEAESLPTELLL
jgi:hypothetical protein